MESSLFSVNGVVTALIEVPRVTIMPDVIFFHSQVNPVF